MINITININILLSIYQYYYCYHYYHSREGGPKFYFEVYFQAEHFQLKSFYYYYHYFTVQVIFTFQVPFIAGSLCFLCLLYLWNQLYFLNNNNKNSNKNNNNNNNDNNNNYRNKTWSSVSNSTQVLYPLTLIPYPLTLPLLPYPHVLLLQVRFLLFWLVTIICLMVDHPRNGR